jgi:hypothetical protein
LYRLDSLPTEREVEHAKGSISGHNRALLDTVSTAIKDDLLRVKEALDIFLRTHGADPGDLAAQGEVLDRVGDTLGMLGLGVPRRVVTEQRQIIGDIASKTRTPTKRPCSTSPARCSTSKPRSTTTLTGWRRRAAIGRRRCRWNCRRPKSARFSMR